MTLCRLESFKTFIFIMVVLFSTALLSCLSHAQTIPDIPGPADVGRIPEQGRAPIPQSSAQTPLKTHAPSETAAPQGSEKLLFTLKAVDIDGMTVFDREEFRSFYDDKIDTEIPASFIWELAAAISQKYKEEGYFLSRAYVPPQKIDKGEVRISIIEGHIAEIDIIGDGEEDRLVQTIVKNIKAQQPLKIQHLESSLLRLNDIYGASYDAVLGKKEDGQDGTARLTLHSREPEKPEITIASNNYGSRYVGPYRTNIKFEESLVDRQKTSVTGLLSKPGQTELALANLSHNIQITPSVELDFMLSRTRSRPGFTLRQNDIESNSFSWGFGAQWIPVRQRTHNFKLFAGLRALNTKTNTFSQALTRDKVRAVSFGGQLDFTDRFLGLNTIIATLSKGIPGLGASREIDTDLSRTNASSNFTKLELSYLRQDFISPNVLLNLNLNGQIASRGLFSSEEFGYGGINIGRAYDFSEITGDHGISALLELQYSGLDPIQGYQINPFIFYDIGKVWNEGDALIKNISAASTGFGVRLYGDNGLNLDTTFAIPLTKNIDSPLYGNGSNPILRFGLNYGFEVNLNTANPQ